jgi:hypothetical protein
MFAAAGRQGSVRVNQKSDAGSNGFMIIIMMHFYKILKVLKLENDIFMKTMFINAEK